MNISARNSSKQQIQKSVGNGKQTMRMKSGKVEDKVSCEAKFLNIILRTLSENCSIKKDDCVDLAVAKINSLLETFMGIHDSELGKNLFMIYICLLFSYLI